MGSSRYEQLFQGSSSGKSLRNTAVAYKMYLKYVYNNEACSAVYKI